MSVYFKNNIKKIREEKGKTQQQLAIWLNVDKSQVCRYEKGEQNLTGDTLKNIADYLGVRIEDIMGESLNRKYDLDKAGNPVVDFTDGQVVRERLFSQPEEHTLTLYPDGIKFSTGCVRRWADISHIQMITLEERKLLILRMSREEEYDSQRWVNTREGKRYGRKITGRPFAKQLYELMGWSMGYTVKVDGIIGTNKNDPTEEIWIFDLENSEMYPMTEKARIKAGVHIQDLKEEDVRLLENVEKEKEEEKIYRKKMKDEGKDPGPMKKYVYYANKWGQYTFGLPVSEHDVIPEIELESKT